MKRIAFATLLAFATLTPVGAFSPLVARVMTTRSDNFNRADAVNLGSPWVSSEPGVDSFYLASNTAHHLFFNSVNVYPAFLAQNYWSTSDYTFSADQCAEATFSRFNNSVTAIPAVYVRFSGTRASHAAYQINSAGDVYWETADGSSGLLADTAEFSTGDVGKICVTGTSIVAYRNGSSIASVTDSHVSSGQPGIGAYSPNTDDPTYGTEIDDFTASDSGSPPPPPSTVPLNALIRGCCRIPDFPRHR